MSLIQGCSFRIGSPFPGAVRGEASAEPRSRYDASIRRRFIIAGFSKESSLADNTLFLTVRKFPSPPPLIFEKLKNPWKHRDRESRGWTTASCDWIRGASVLWNASTFPHYGGVTQNDGNSRSVLTPTVICPYRNRSVIKPRMMLSI